MAQPARSRIQVLTYLVIVFAFSSFFYFLIIHSGSLGYGRGMYVFGLMWCPALAGMLTLRLNGRSISELGWKWAETKYQLRSWYIPILYASIAYAIIWIFHSARSAIRSISIRLRSRCTWADLRGFPLSWELR
ncbi:MAG TPA: hypothetical protein VKH63_04470 [Candidatus Acidoferrum sp.]|jgi:hypothetical protein|nr:hypothetical protein [Candidatus Acidoferrum sp.]